MSEITASLDVASTLNQIAGDESLAAVQASAFQARWGGVEDVRTLKAVQARLPQGADQDANDVMERLMNLERQYAAPHLLSDEYDQGVSVSDDEIRTLFGGPVLVTAEHATNPFRKSSGRREAADQGTAALAAAMAEDGLAEALLMTGRQQGNAGVTENHPIKLLAHDKLADHTGFLSIHSKLPGQAPGLFDTSEVHAYVGLGRYEPRESTLIASEQIIRVADDLGLRAMIGNTTYHPIYRKDPEWQAPGPLCDRLNELSLNDERLPRVSRLAGYSAESTTSWMNRVTADNSQHNTMPILQLEISNSLCVTAVDRYVRDKKAHAMGVYLGYLFARRVTELMARVAT